MKQLLVIFTLAIALKYASADCYTYLSPGFNCDMWSTISPSCGEANQSPINIETDGKKLNKVLLAPLEFHNHDTEPLFTTLVLDRFGLKINSKYSSNKNAYISGGRLPARYNLDHATLHWGQTENDGSEHQIDAKAGAGELVLVYLKDGYNTLDEATNKDLGVVAVSFILAIGANSYFDIITGPLDDFGVPNRLESLYQNTTVPLTYSSLLRLGMFNDITSWYQYEGGRTMVPCQPKWTRIVATQNVEISHTQLNALRSLKVNPSGGQEKPILANNREVQNVDNRQVETPLTDDLLATVLLWFSRGYKYATGAADTFSFGLYYEFIGKHLQALPYTTDPFGYIFDLLNPLNIIGGILGGDD